MKVRTVLICLILINFSFIPIVVYLSKNYERCLTLFASKAYFFETCMNKYELYEKETRTKIKLIWIKVTWRKKSTKMVSAVIGKS